MLNIVKTLLIVLAITSVVWLFAEAESLTERSEITRLRIVVPQGQESQLSLDYQQAATSQVTIELRGTRASLDAARQILNNGITLSPDQAGIAASDGPQQLSLLQVFSNFPDLIEQRVEVLSVRPPTLTVIRTELMEVEMPIALEARGLTLEDIPTIEPQSATVRLPARTPSELYQGQTIAAFLPTDFDPSSVEPGERVRFQDIELALPASLLPRPDTAIVSSTRVAVEFVIRSASAVQTIDNIYTWIVLPWDQAEQWVVRVAPEDQVRAVTFSGPEEQLSELNQSGTTIIAAVTLTFDQLAQGEAEVEPALFLRTESGLVPLPQGVNPVSSLVSVRVTSEQLPVQESSTP